MKHDHRTRRRAARTTECFWRIIEGWRERRLARRALAEMSRRKNAHLLDDSGIDSADAYCRRDRVQRHRFWML